MGDFWTRSVEVSPSVHLLLRLNRSFLHRQYHRASHGCKCVVFDGEILFVLYFQLIALVQSPAVSEALFTGLQAGALLLAIFD
ncbi:MAG: hypothetical protein AB4426_04620 [Xenococcaceae cyanobacterium]